MVMSHIGWVVMDGGKVRQVGKGCARHGVKQEKASSLYHEQVHFREMKAPVGLR